MVRALETVTVSEAHYGPLPDPETLARYERDFPGLAERIIRMAEKPLEMGEEQMHHRQELESRVIQSDIRRSWAGLAVATLLSALVLAGGIFLAYEGKEAAGLGAVASGLAALTLTFLKGKSSQEVKLQEEPATLPVRR